MMTMAMTIARRGRSIKMEEIMGVSSGWQCVIRAQVIPASRVEVILTGGTLRRAIHALVGPAAEESVRQLRASSVFISGNGLTAERGLSTPSPLVAATDRALASAAQQVVVLADYTKIGQETMCQTVPSDRVSTLITDSGADPVQLEASRAAGIAVRIANVGDHAEARSATA